MKKISAFSIAFFLFVSLANAQIEHMDSTELANMIGNLTNSTALMPQVDTYVGSPYFTDWVRGYFILDNNKRTNELKTRYNMKNNSVQFLRKGEVYAISGKKLNEYVIHATGQEGNIIFKNGFSSKRYNINSSKLLRVIYDGNVKLLAYEISKLMNNVAAYGVAGDVNEFRSDTFYYLVTSDGTFHKVDLNKDDILGVLPGENKKLQEFVAKTNLNFNKQLQLDNILSYYDMLQKAKSNINK